MNEKGASIQDEMLQVWNVSHDHCPAADDPLGGVVQDVTVEVSNKDTRAEGFTFVAHVPPQGTALLPTEIYGGECQLEVHRTGCPVDLM